MTEFLSTPVLEDPHEPLPYAAEETNLDPRATPPADEARVRPTPEPVIVLAEGSEVPTLGVVELLLKDEAALNRLLDHPARQRELLPKFMTIAVICFAIYGLVTTGVLNGFAWRGDYWLAHLPPARLGQWSVGNLTAAYTLGLIAANGICLPSFYFYGLLAGLRTTMLTIAVHALKSMASGGVALVGLLPIYVAVALTALVTPAHWISGYRLLTLIALLLPFVAGLRGAASLYVGLTGLAATMRPARRAQRECFLKRLILAWVGCFTFVTPVVIYSLWSLLGHLTAGFGG